MQHLLYDETNWNKTIRSDLDDIRSGLTIVETKIRGNGRTREHHYRRPKIWASASFTVVNESV
jgi:hypothetical protein